MPTGVHIRPATPADAHQVSRIGRTAMPAQYAGLVDPAAVAAAVAQTYDPVAVADCIARCDAAGDACFFVAERDGAVLGYLHFDAWGPEPELHRLYIDPRSRGSGVGGALMRALHERLASPEYMLLVVDGNGGAIRFYERHELTVEARVDGLTYYRERMGVEFPPGTRPFALVLMRRS